MEKINDLNADPDIHGIIVQLPLDTDRDIDTHAVRQQLSSNFEVL